MEDPPAGDLAAEDPPAEDLAAEDPAAWGPAEEEAYQEELRILEEAEIKELNKRRKRNQGDRDRYWRNRIEKLEAKYAAARQARQDGRPIERALDRAIQARARAAG